MGVQYDFFVIPALDGQDVSDEMNRFMRSVKVVQVHREFVSQGDLSYWAFAIEYLSGESTTPKPKRPKAAIDYKEILSPEDFAVYAKLRDWRKETALREGVPPYVIFTGQPQPESWVPACAPSSPGQVDADLLTRTALLSPE